MRFWGHFIFSGFSTELSLKRAVRPKSRGLNDRWKIHANHVKGPAEKSDLCGCCYVTNAESRIRRAEVIATNQE